MFLYLAAKMVMAPCNKHLSHGGAEAGDLLSFTSAFSIYCDPLHLRVELHVVVCGASLKTSRLKQHGPIER